MQNFKISDVRKQGLSVPGITIKLPQPGQQEVCIVQDVGKTKYLAYMLTNNIIKIQVHLKSLLQSVKLRQGAMLISEPCFMENVGPVVIPGQGLELPTCNRNHTGPRERIQVPRTAGQRGWDVMKKLPEGLSVTLK